MSAPNAPGDPDPVPGLSASWRRWPGVAIAISLIATAIFVALQASEGARSWIITYGFPDPFQIFRGEVWRLMTGPMVHRELWHFLSNLVFFFLLATVCQRLTSWRMTLWVFAGGVLVGHMAEIHLTKLGHGVIGMSGGIFALWSYVLARHLAMRRTDRSRWVRALLILYPLITLPGAILGHVTRTWVVGHYVHLAGALFGLVVALSSHRVAVGTVIAALATLVWSPWLLHWRAAHGRLPSVVVLSEAPEGPTGEPGLERRVYVYNAGTSLKRFYRVDGEGEEHLEFSTRRSAATHFTGTFASFPRAISDRWVVRDDAGRLLAAFDLSDSPHAALLLDLRQTSQ